MTVTGTGTAVSVPNGTVSAYTITNTTLTTTNAAITNLTSNLNAATYNISGVGTLTANTIQKTTTGDLTIQQTGNSSILLIASGVNGIYTQVGTAGFQVVNVGNTVNYTTINSTDATFSVNVGLSSGKTLTLNGASAIQNSTASQTYRVLSTFKHSFEVVSGTEIAKIDSTGLTITSGKTLTTPSITYAGNITYNASASTSNTHSFQIADNSRVVVNNDGITANSSANNQPALRLWTYTTPSANTSNNGAYIGVGTGTNQCGIINFGYAGSGNPSNYLGFGLFGADDLLKVYPSSVSVGGNVGIGSTTPGGLLDVYYLSATPCSLFKVTNGLISMNMSGLDGTFISQSYDVVTIGKNYTGSSVSNSGRSASYIYLSSPVSASAEISFYISDTNGGIPGKIMTVNSSGINISATKIFTLNGNSSTSTLEMSNSTGVLKLQNNNNSNSYEVPTSQIHSFKVNAVEIAKIDGTGLTSTNLKTTSASNQSTAQPLIYAGSNANNMVLCDNLHQTYNFMDILGYPGWTKIVNTPNFVKYTDGSIINFWGSGSCFNLAGVFTYTVAIYNSANTLQQSLSFTSCYFDNNTQSRKNTSWGGVFTSIPAGTYYLQMRTAAANNNSDGGDNAIMSWSITSS